VTPLLEVPRGEDDTEMLGDRDLVGLMVLVTEPEREVDIVRVAPPPPGAAREGEAVLHCEVLRVLDGVALGQRLAVRVTLGEGVGRGVAEVEALALMVKEARGVTLAKAEEVEDGEGLVLLLPLRVALAGLAETNALAE
jgi:hypothetical protein